VAKRLGKWTRDTRHSTLGLCLVTHTQGLDKA
jgi:hypothetical protein